MPNLILLNGNPGLGKSTMAQRYIDEHPMALNLDIDNIWILMGGWRTEPLTNMLKLKYAHTIANMHLSEGYDVIVPQLMQTIKQYEDLETIAVDTNATMYEFMLQAPMQVAVERFKTRARAMGFPDGFRPGGIIDTHGREARLETIYTDVLATIALRPNIVTIESIEHDIDGTYSQILKHIEQS